jgi:hypothetical protein
MSKDKVVIASERSDLGSEAEMASSQNMFLAMTMTILSWVAC